MVHQAILLMYMLQIIALKMIDFIKKKHNSGNMALAKYTLSIVLWLYNRCCHDKNGLSRDKNDGFTPFLELREYKNG